MTARTGHDLLVNLIERVEHLEGQAAEVGRLSVVAEVNAARGTIVTDGGQEMQPISLTRRLRVQPVVGEQVVSLGNGLCLCGVVPILTDNSGEDVDELVGVFRHDRESGEVGLGANPTSPVALSDLTEARIKAIEDLLKGPSTPAPGEEPPAGVWSPVGTLGDGVALQTAAKAAFGSVQSVAAKKVSAE